MSEEEAMEKIVKEWNDSDMTQAEVATKYGINLNTLRNWIYHSTSKEKNNGEAIDITDMIKRSKVRFSINGFSIEMEASQLRPFLEAIRNDQVR